LRTTRTVDAASDAFYYNEKTRTTQTVFAAPF